MNKHWRDLVEYIASQTCEGIYIEKGPWMVGQRRIDKIPRPLVTTFGRENMLQKNPSCAQKNWKGG